MRFKRKEVKATESIFIRVRENELNELKRRALLSHSGNLTQYLLTCGLGKRLPDQTRSALIVALLAIAREVKEIRAEFPGPFDEKLNEILHEIVQAIQRVDSR